MPKNKTKSIPQERSTPILISEVYVSSGSEGFITEYQIGIDSFIERKNHSNKSNITGRALLKILKDTLLPSGYPNSVKPEYLEYQIWDAIQGISSSLRSVLATRSVLQGAGVGSLTSSPLAAAVSWVIRDGCGMVGSLALAYSCSCAFEVYTKEWRLLADLLNNLGLALDLISGYFPDNKWWYTICLIASSLAKACCGLIAGATKARISSHFAVKGHLADVAAKESTQETAGALIGLLIGTLLAGGILQDDDFSISLWFIIFTIIHIFANYSLIRVLVFDNLNCQRSWIISSMLITDPNADISPKKVASKETLLRPFYLAFYGPQLGVRMLSILEALQHAFKGVTYEHFFETSRTHKFAIMMKSGKFPLIAVAQSANDYDIIKSYFIVCYLMIETSKLHHDDRSMVDVHGLQDKALLWWDSVVSQKLLEYGWLMSDAAPLGMIQYRYALNELDKKAQ